MLMNPPIKGARSGPLKTVIENTVIARPLCRLLNISAKTAPTQVSGQAPKNPPKNLEIMIVCVSFATATARLNIENPKLDRIKGHLRPYNSDAGAQLKKRPQLVNASLTSFEFKTYRIGPVAKPRT